MSIICDHLDWFLIVHLLCTTLRVARWSVEPFLPESAALNNSALLSHWIFCFHKDLFCLSSHIHFPNFVKYINGHYFPREKLILNVVGVELTPPWITLIRCCFLAHIKGHVSLRGSPIGQQSSLYHWLRHCLSLSIRYPFASALPSDFHAQLPCTTTSF